MIPDRPGRVVALTVAALGLFASGCAGARAPVLRPSGGAAGSGGASGTEAPPPSISYPGQPTRTTRPPQPVATSPNPASVPTPVAGTPPAPVEPFRFESDVVFETLSAELTPQGGQEVTDAAAVLDRSLREGQTAEVHGWCDSRGSLAFNSLLSELRVAAVIEALVSHAPRLRGRLVPVPHGEIDPPDPDCLGDCPTNRIVLVSVRVP